MGVCGAVTAGCRLRSAARRTPGPAAIHASHRGTGTWPDSCIALTKKRQEMAAVMSIPTAARSTVPYMPHTAAPMSASVRLITPPMSVERTLRRAAPMACRPMPAPIPAHATRVASAVGITSG